MSNINRLEKLKNTFDKLPYPECNKDSADFKLFDEFFEKYLNQEKYSNYVVLENVIQGDFPYLRRNLFYRVYRPAINKNNRNPNEPISIFEDPFWDDRFEQVLEADAEAIEQCKLIFNIPFELSELKVSLGEIFKTTSDPDIVYERCDLLQYLSRDTQVEIMKNYIKAAHSCTNDNPDALMPPEVAVSNLVCELFEVDREPTYNSYDNSHSSRNYGFLMVSKEAIGVLLGHLLENYPEEYNETLDFLHKHRYVHNIAEYEECAQMSSVEIKFNPN
ncbi:MAG: hypothetical protein LBN07_03265 [Christensenellaceae bacterium]|jgi:hypothetical protein|nr:hypothetical protein [Christensenellaceae bacterium]